MCLFCLGLAGRGRGRRGGGWPPRRAGGAAAPAPPANRHGSPRRPCAAARAAARAGFFRLRFGEAGVMEPDFTFGITFEPAAAPIEYEGLGFLPGHGLKQGCLLYATDVRSSGPRRRSSNKRAAGRAASPGRPPLAAPRRPPRPRRHARVASPTPPAGRTPPIRPATTHLAWRRKRAWSSTRCYWTISRRVGRASAAARTVSSMGRPPPLRSRPGSETRLAFPPLRQRLQVFSGDPGAVLPQGTRLVVCNAKKGARGRRPVLRPRARVGFAGGGRPHLMQAPNTQAHAAKQAFVAPGSGRQAGGPLAGAALAAR